MKADLPCLHSGLSRRPQEHLPACVLHPTLALSAGPHLGGGGCLSFFSPDGKEYVCKMGRGSSGIKEEEELSPISSSTTTKVIATKHIEEQGLLRKGWHRRTRLSILS